MAVYNSSRTDPSRESSVFATKGGCFRIGNFDGTAARPDWLLCAYKPVDLTVQKKGTAVLDPTGKAPLMLIKTSPGVGSVMTRHVLDFSFVPDLRNVQPADVVAAFNSHCTPTLPEMTASYNNLPRAVNLYCTNPNVKITEVFGTLAGALGFGGGEAFTSYGSFFFNFITDDSTITIAPTNVMGDSTTAQLMGGFRNTETAVIINGRRSGVDFAVNVKKTSPLIMQMIMGAEVVFLPDGEGADVIPLNPNKIPKGRIEMYSPRDRHTAWGQSDIDTTEGVIIEHVHAAGIVLGDDARGAVSLDSFNFTLQARVYRDIDGSDKEQPEILFRGTNDEFLECLMDAMETRPLISMLNVVTAQTLSVPSTMSYPKQTGPIDNQGQCTVTPPNASGYVVAVTEPASGALGCTFKWDDDNKRMVTTTGNTAGTETITVTLTNADGTVLTGTCSVTVS